MVSALVFAMGVDLGIPCAGMRISAYTRMAIDRISCHLQLNNHDLDYEDVLFQRRKPIGNVPFIKESEDSRLNSCVTNSRN